MFSDLYDAVSLLWSWRWPTANGKVTAVDIERIRHSNGRYDARLAVAYEFSIGDDGPYTGESFLEAGVLFCKTCGGRSTENPYS